MTLSILIWLPLAVSLIASRLPVRAVARISVAGAVVSLGIAISFVVRFKLGPAGLQFITDQVWISALGIHYKLGLDGLNVVLVLLTTVIFLAALLYAATRDWDSPRVFYFHFGLAQSAVLGAFCAQDLALFVVFFDLMLVPFYFLTGIWGATGDEAGGRDRVTATTKLVIYTLVGSFFMLVAAIATGVLASSQHGTPLTFVITSLRGLPLSHSAQEWIFLGFAAAFLVKMPLVPLHGWLPDGYKAMPIPAVAVFSAILSKVAAYGFLRIVLPLFPYASAHFQILMLLIALASVIWATLLAMTTPDARLVVAYSSVAQLGFIVLGIFSLRPEGGQGALLQMINHALVTAPLFFIVAALAARAGGSEKLAAMGGLAFRAPVLASLFLIVSLATLAIPGSSNFIGEFMILLGLFKAKLAMAMVASLGVVGAAAYALRLYIGAMHGPSAGADGLGGLLRKPPGGLAGADRLEGPLRESGGKAPGGRSVSLDLRMPEAIAIVPVLAVILALAFYPQFGLRRSEPSLKAAVRPAELISAGRRDTVLASGWWSLQPGAIAGAPGH